MKYKKGLVFICLIICLFSISGVCAGDVNDTAIASDDSGNILEESDEEAISLIDDLNEEIISEETNNNGNLELNEEQNLSEEDII